MTFPRFEYIKVPSWPHLAWLSRCRRGSEVVEVFHGSWVETKKDWFCEGVWAGSFAEGNFDQTDIVSGSGGRARERRVVFVTSGSTVDRLQSLSTSDEVLVSNSMCCLLAMTKATFDPIYPYYHREFSSINQGLSQYIRYIKSSAGQVELTYFDNVVWNGETLSRTPKKETAPVFTSFIVYRDYLESTMRLVADCASASDRQQPFRPLCAISNGYDSSTVAIIARDAGDCHETFTFDVDREGVDDSGATIAKYLNMRCSVIQRNSWQKLDRPEIPFLAGSPGGSDVLFAGAEGLLAGTVLFTGFHGDAVWSKISKVANEQFADIVRNDGSGRSLTEYRLWAGFIHCPVPFWGARQGHELIEISRSKEMKEWDFALRGSYSRPICRRIIEEAGVPRDAFGVGKRGISVQFTRPQYFMTSNTFDDYCFWLKEKRQAWFFAGRLPPVPIIAQGFDLVLTSSAKFLDWVVSCIPVKRPFQTGRAVIQACVNKIHKIQYGNVDPLYLRRYTYPWAVEQAKRRYPLPLLSQDESAENT